MGRRRAGAEGPWEGLQQPKEAHEHGEEGGIQLLLVLEGRHEGRNDDRGRRGEHPDIGDEGNERAGCNKDVGAARSPSPLGMAVRVAVV